MGRGAAAIRGSAHLTTQKSFKRLVRARMAKTGESYTAARAMLLAPRDEPATPGVPMLATSDAAIRERTGHGWEAWFDRLDAWGAAGRPHREIARWVAGELGVDALAWNAQAIAYSYERTHGLRAAGERDDGFAVTVSRTVGVPVERLFDGFLAAAPEDLRERTATRPRSARFDWGDAGSRVHVSFDAKGEERSTATVEHRRLADAEEAERMRAWWRERLDALRAGLEAAGAGR
jgi:hypothetical protein